MDAKIGFARLLDAAGATVTGKKVMDLYLLDAKFAVSKDLTVGGSYYVVRDDTTFRTADLHMVGVNAAAMT